MQNRVIRFVNPLVRMWRIATCNHRNACMSIEFADTTEIMYCRACGRVLWITDDGSRRHNPHLLRDQTDWKRAAQGGDDGR